MVYDRRHYVPAALLGHFSDNPDLRSLRKSVLSVHRFSPEVDFTNSAENLASSRELYRQHWFDGLDMDRYLAGGENHALEPIEVIETSSSGAIPLREWAKVAYFVASQVVRNPDREREIAALAAEEIGLHVAAPGYPIDLPRVAAAVVRARWEFVSSAKDFIVNDRAIATVQFGDWGMRGYFIPVRKRVGFRIGGLLSKAITWSGRAWEIDIPIRRIPDDQVDNLNAWTWASAVEEVYGPTPEALREASAIGDDIREHIPDLASYSRGAELLGLDGQGRRDGETLLRKLFGLAAADVNGDPPQYRA